MNKIVIALAQGQKTNYTVVYLRLSKDGSISSIEEITKVKLINELFHDYSNKKRSTWKVLQKKTGHIVPIELIDFVGLNTNNTHFGEIATVVEFNNVLRELNINISLSDIAC